MGTCDRCRHSCPHLYEIVESEVVTEWDDQEYEKRAYSLILDEETAGMMFTGQEVRSVVETVSHLCVDCYAQWLAQRESVAREARMSGTEEHVSSNPFAMRMLQSDLSVSLAKALFEYCGYEVRESGYEHTVPQWMSRMKEARDERNITRVRYTPDLMVFDRADNILHEVEVKTTTLCPTNWIYSKQRLDGLRSHHPDATLMVYSQATSHFSVQDISAIEWSGLPVRDLKGVAYYEVNLDKAFLFPQQLFPRITAESYRDFRRLSQRVLDGFSRSE